MRFKIERSWKLTKVGKVLLAILGVVLIGSGYFYYYFGNKNIVNKTNQSESQPTTDSPIYYAIQDDVAKIYIYDTVNKKNKQLLKIPLEKNFYRFGADYSAKNNQLVYSDTNGIWSYDMVNGNKTELLANKSNDSKTDEDNSKYYSNPKFSRDGKYIFFSRSYAEGPGSILGYMSASGKDVTEIKNLYSSANNLIWTKDNRYVVHAGMEGATFAVSTSNDYLKTTSINLTKEIESFSAYDINTNENQLIVSGTKYDDNKQSSLIYSINLDATNLQKIVDTSTSVNGLLYDPYEKDVIFSQTDYTNKKGLGLYQIQDGKATEYYKDGDKDISPVSISKDFVAVSSKTFSQTNFSLKSLYLINKKDKNIINIGESGENGFVGWIKSNRLPSNLTEVSNLAPTDQENKEYKNSLKSQGYLSGSFYDYCWDYDCTSATYPYSELSQSKMPEVVNVYSKPEKLSNDVTIPVIFAYDSTLFTDEQISALQNSEQIGSYGYFAKWLNNQAKENKANLNFQLDYKTKQFQIDQSCITIQGTTRLLDQSCLKKKIIAVYPELKDAKDVFIAIARDSSENYTYNVSYNYISEGSLIYTPISTYYLEQSIANFTDNLNKYYYGFNYYNTKQFLSQYGGKDLIATYKQPTNDAQSACYVDARWDIMCGSWLSDTNKGIYDYIKLTEAKITDVTAKALGWYDADGDGVDEVDDKCPFNKDNNC